MNERPATKDRIIWILLFAVAAAVYLFALGLPLVGPDEPRYAQVAREMFERGDWVTPTLGGFTWFEKPALLYWLQIAFYNLFGVSEFAARLGSALFGLGTIFSLWVLGKKVQSSEFRVQGLGFRVHGLETEDRDSAGGEFALWLGLIAASSLGLLIFSRGASFDIIITFPITASLVSFFIWEIFETSEKTKSWAARYLPLSLFYFFIGVALIAKGLIGAVFPLAIVSFYFVLRWRLPQRVFVLSLVWGSILAALVASLWYLPVYLQNGWEFVDEFFIQHHFQRFTSNKFKHPQPFWFFWVIFPLFTIPWILFFFAAVYKAFSRQLSFISEKLDFKTKKSEPETKKSKLTAYHSPLTAFALSWMLVPLVFFSMSGSKLPGYILPALPAACILTALCVTGFVRNKPGRKYALQALAFLTFTIVAALLLFVVPEYARRDSTKHLIAAAERSGYKTEEILNLHTISHNLEFYAHGRLVRNTDGTQKRFEGVAEILERMKYTSRNSILVIVPKKYSNQLAENHSIETETLETSGEFDLIAVKSK